MRRRVTEFLHLPVVKKKLWLEALYYLAQSRFRVWQLPFRAWKSRLGEHMSHAPLAVLDSRQQLLVKDISWAVASAANHAPFQAVCLPQAMAAKAMLRRRHIPSVLYLGMKKGEKEAFDAHAWVRVGDISVTGGEVDEFVSVSHFI